MKSSRIAEYHFGELPIDIVAGQHGSLCGWLALPFKDHQSVLQAGSLGNGLPQQSLEVLNDDIPRTTLVRDACKDDQRGPRGRILGIDLLLVGRDGFMDGCQNCDGGTS